MNRHESCSFVAMQVLSIELLELTRHFGVFDGSWFGKVGLSTCFGRLYETLFYTRIVTAFIYACVR